MATLDPRAVGKRMARSGRDARDRALDALAGVVYREPVCPPGRLALWLAYAARLASPERLAEVVAANLEAHGPAVLRERAEQAMERLGSKERPRRALLGAVWDALLERDPDGALGFGDRLIDGVSHPPVARGVARMLADRGAVERPLALLQRFPLKSTERLDALVQQAQLLRGGYRLPERAARRWQATERRAIYFHSQSMPHHTSGYAIRSHWMLRHLAARGWDMTGVTRFGYPSDRADHAGAGELPPGSAEIEGVRYRFAPDRRGFREPESDYIDRAARALCGEARELRPALLHAASNYQVGLAAAAAARQLGLPSIYEVRGLWHLTRTSKDPDYDRSEHYRMSERLEVEAARAADHVFAITGAVLDLLADGGVDRAKMSLLPNAVDTDQFAPRPRDDRLAAELGLSGKVVIGTVGTFKWYEGLDLLLHAAASMRRSLGDTFRVLLVGDGPVSDDLAALRTRLGLGDMVVMTGRVPHDRVTAYYSLIDVAAYPRTAARVTHFVSPLKPLEAMATEKAVVVSDVKAQAEMVEHEVTGLVHPAGDTAALERTLTRLVTAPALRAELAARARSWVTAHRSWPATAALVTEVYDRLLAT